MTTAPESTRWDALSWMIPAMIALVLVGCGVAAGWWWAHPDGPRQEPPAPAQRQADGSLILERRPDLQARPRQKIPPGKKLERVAQVTVQPDAPAPAAGKPCPPVTIDLSLVRDPDGAHRVMASSPDGQVVGGLDIPVAPTLIPPPEKRWAAGLSWSPLTRTSGLWVERDVRVPLIDLKARVGLDVVEADSGRVEGRLRVGVAF